MTAGFEPFEVLCRADVARCYVLRDAPSGLRALIVLDDLTLGPAAGGIRTRPYGSWAEAVRDAARLARAMTVKCALAGLDAGGGKAVVLEHEGLDRRRAFAALADRIEELGGLFRTAGDLGTTRADLAVMSEHTRFVHADESRLTDAASRGVLRCVEACAQMRGRDVPGLRVAVQGCGAIGAAVARALAAAGCSLLLADVDGAKAEQLAAALDARPVHPDAIWDAEVDLVAPCALGEVITVDVARRLRAWALCGAANNQLADAAAARVLADRGILHVPDPVASAGAVVDGIARTVMGVADPADRVDALGGVARRVLEQSRRTGRPTPEVAEHLAYERISLK